MSDRPRVLQRGQARRGRVARARPHWGIGRRAAGFTACGALITLTALLALMSASASSPSLSIPHARAGEASAAPTPVRSDYGLVPAPPSERVSVTLKLPLRSGLLFDVNSGAVLRERRPEQVLPIASLTKMMTALIVAAHVRPGAPVLITPAAVHFTGSGVGMLPLGKHVSALSLLYGLLLPSGNDAAIALAQHVAGTRSRFIAMMNARARQLGLSCTHYNSVSGVVDYDNHSCAGDLALLAHLVLGQPLLARIVGSSSAVLPFPVKGGKLFLYNNNPLLVQGYPGADGVKTGYTSAAGTCLVATARRGRAWLGVVLLNSGNIAAQAETLLNAGFARLGAA